MKSSLFQARGWRRRLLALLTLVVIFCIASNPALATLVPVIDALGLDVLFYLFAAQLTVMLADGLLPYVRHLYQHRGRPLLNFATQVLYSGAGGYLRQLTAHVRSIGLDGFRHWRRQR